MSLLHDLLSGEAGRPATRTYAVIATITVVFYFHTLFFGLVYLDDAYFLAGNAAFLRSPEAWTGIFKAGFFLSDSSATAYYRPLSLLPWVLASRLEAASFWPFHLLNVSLHAGAACLFLSLLFRLGYRGLRPLFAALLFVVHPVPATVVSFLPGAAYSLLICLVLAIFHFAADYLERGGARPLALHALLFACAMLTLESAAGLLPALLLFGLFARPAGRARVALLLAGALPGLALWFAGRALYLPSGLPPLDIAAALANLPVIFAGFEDLMIPLPAVTLGSFGWKDAVPGLACAGLLLLAQSRGFVKNRRMFLFGGAWYLFFMAPGLFTGFGLNHMPHRAYIPFLGILLMGMELELSALRSAGLVRGLALAVLLAFAAAGLKTTLYYRDLQTFWKQAGADMPGNPYPRQALADALLRTGRFGEAERELRAYLAWRPEDTLYRARLGFSLFAQGRLEEAGAQFRTGAAASSGCSECYYGLGQVAAASGRYREAERSYRFALGLRGDYPQCRFALAGTLEKLGQLEAAEQECRLALASKGLVTDGPPDYPGYRDTLAFLLVTQKRYAEAAEEYRRAVALRPGDAMSVSNLAGALTLAGDEDLKGGRLAQAEGRFREALAADPGNVQAAQRLAILAPSAGSPR